MLYFIPVDKNKIPLTVNGEKNAKTLAEKSREEWLKEFPGCNFAICTGPSGLIAVDSDLYKKIYVAGSLEEAIGQALPETLTWRTGRGGKVHLYKYDGELPISRNGVLPGIDIKARTGYVLAPGSVNATGQRYEIENAAEIADAPAALVNWLNTLGQKKAAMPSRGQTGFKEIWFESGNGRWEQVRRFGGYLRRRGLGELALYEMLQSLVRHHCEYDETLRDGELRRLARWLATTPTGDDLNREPIKVAMPDGSTEEFEAVEASAEFDEKSQFEPVKQADGSWLLVPNKEQE